MPKWINRDIILEILDENKKARQISFNSENKWMAVVAENPVCTCNLCKPDRITKKPVENINCKK